MGKSCVFVGRLFSLFSYERMLFTFSEDRMTILWREKVNFTVCTSLMAKSIILCLRRDEEKRTPNPDECSNSSFFVGLMFFFVGFLLTKQASAGWEREWLTLLEKSVILSGHFFHSHRQKINWQHKQKNELSSVREGESEKDNTKWPLTVVRLICRTRFLHLKVVIEWEWRGCTDKNKAKMPFMLEGVKSLSGGMKAPRTSLVSINFRGW